MSITKEPGDQKDAVRSEKPRGLSAAFASRRSIAAQDVIPLATSLAIHAAILVIGYLGFRAIQGVPGPASEEQTIVPVSTFDQNNPLIALQSLNTGDDLTAVQRALDPSTLRGGESEVPGNHLAPTPSDRAADAPSDGTDGPLPTGVRGAVLDGNSHDAAGDALGLFGPPGEIGAMNPTFGPLGGNVRRIVYICDATGSMLNKLQSVKDQMRKSIASLQPVQNFDIIFFQDHQKILFSPNLVPATPQIKRQAEQFLDGVIAQSITDPLPALEMAMKLHPQLIYFLTDAADFPDPRGILDLIAKNNADHAIHINTILFVTDRAEHEKNQDSEAFMKKVASENHGTFRWVEMMEIR